MHTAGAADARQDLGGLGPDAPWCIGRRRFTYALLAAASIHALAIGWRLGARRMSVRSAESAHRTEQQIELELSQPLGGEESRRLADRDNTKELSVAELPASPQRRGATAQSAQMSEKAEAITATTAKPEASAGEVSTPAAAIVASEAGSATDPALSAPAASTAIDLGLDGRILRPTYREVEARQRSSSERRAEVQRNLDASFRTAAVAEDARRGYGRGNIFIGALSSAVRVAGPPVGEAVISASFNAMGELNGLTLVQGTVGDWSRAIQAFRTQAKQKRVPMPSGAKGLRITFRVAAKIQKPSGKEIDVSSLNLKRPSLAANGLTLRGDFDLADLSGKSTQSVSARVLSEEVLD